MYRHYKTMTNTTERVLVHFYKDSGNIKANFTQSVADTLGINADQNDMSVYSALTNNHMVLSADPWGTVNRPVKLRRPAFCPLHHLTLAQHQDIPPEILARGTDVGCATIVETADHKVLLTRRAANLRTFPNVWVPPGGHVELNETLHDGGLRELHEETGLRLSAEDCVGQQIPILALWESCYPPKLSSGLPKRHHIVIYLYARLKPSLTSAALQAKLRPEPQEVGACAWLDEATVQRLLHAGNEEDTSTESESSVEMGGSGVFSATLVHDDGSLAQTELNTSILYQKAPESGGDVERISTGTKFALEEWLKFKASSPSNT